MLRNCISHRLAPADLVLFAMNSCMYAAMPLGEQLMSLNCVQMPKSAVETVSSFRHRSFSQSCRSISAIEEIFCAATSPFKPESCTSSTDGERKAVPTTAGTEGPWLDPATRRSDGHMEQDLLSTSQAHLFTAAELQTYRSLNFLGLW